MPTSSSGVSSQAPDAQSDPLGVIVELVAGRRPGLGRAKITEVVASIAGGRAKARRLAEALLARPAILSDGRSPAPEGLGKLLTALRQAGAVNVSAPVCAECGKALKAFQRRGQDWYCGVHGPNTAACAVCGKVRPIAGRDRAHQPHCAQHLPLEEQDPTQVLLGFIGRIDPELAPQAVATAIDAAAPQPAQRRRLAWALEDRPELLTGAGAEAPVPAVLRLIDALTAHGSRRIVPPPCPGCGRLIALVKPRGGVRLCRNCLAKSRAETCIGCGAHREPATRDSQGRALCAKCLINDPDNHQICLKCARLRPVSVRTATGIICGSCRPVATVTCSICGRVAAGSISKLTGAPCCHACTNRRARCTSCSNVRLIRSGTPTAPLCGPCTGPDAAWHSCRGCGEPIQQRSSRCARCTVQRRLKEVLHGDEGKEVFAPMQQLYQHLADHDRPETVLTWLSKHSTAQILGELATGQRSLTHAGLDELPDAKPLQHLRAVLVATGALPARDEQLTRLEHWITATIATRSDPDQRELLHRYAIWHALRRLRARNNGKHVTNGQRLGVQANIRAAITLLDWLTAAGLDLTNAAQPDLEQWLSSAPATTRPDAGNFVRWARRNKLTSLDFAATRWDGPRSTIDSEARWGHARRLLHDDALAPEDRVAGLLVLLYAQPTAAISRLTLDRVHLDEHQVRLQLGPEPIVVPEPLAALVRELIDHRHGHATLGDHGASPWLFPGGRPGQPISAHQLGQRLHQLGLRPGQARSTALFGLAAELPAALLSRLLGIHISVAVAWQHACAGDWSTYAADYSRRAEPHHRADPHNRAEPSPR